MSRHMWLVTSLSLALVTGCMDDPDIRSAHQAASVKSITQLPMKSLGASASFDDYSKPLWGGISVWEGTASSAVLNYWLSTPDPASLLCEEMPCKCEMAPPCPPDDPACTPCACPQPPATYCRYTRFIYTNAYGTIPAKDLSFVNGVATLKTTVAPGPSFTIDQCIEDYATGSFQCSPGAGASISVTWSNNNLYSWSQSGTNEQTSGPYTFRTSGTTKMISADVTGSVLGSSFSNSSGQILKSAGAAVQKTISFAP